MATCPNCGVSSRVDEGALWLADELVAKPLGTWSLAGAQMKTVVQRYLRLHCRCGWSIRGHVEDGEFLGDRSTQIFPEK